MNQQQINAAADNHAQQFNDAQGHKLSFLAGAAFAQDGGMRWVKASERLPEVSGQYYCRYSDEPDRKHVFRFMNGKFEYVSQSLLLLIEWLDESPNINQGGEKTL